MLRRDIGLWRGIALNMIDMVGIGPFITIPLILAAMGGGRGMLAWILGGLLAISDGLVTAELSASMPASGGSYAFLRGGYGRFSISFDAFGMPLHWGGFNLIGGMGDPSTDDGYDRLRDFGYALTPGTWTVSPTPTAAVPLPAALPLFATGLGVMGLLGWRRKRKTAR